MTMKWIMLFFTIIAGGLSVNLLCKKKKIYILQQN